MSDRLAQLAARLALTDDETLAIFSLDPLAAIGGAHAHRPEVEILDELTRDAEQRVGELALRRWLRSPLRTPPAIELLERGEFDGFELALERWLSESGVDGAAG